MKMNPKDIMRMTQEEAFEAMQTWVPSMRCEFPQIGAVEGRGITPNGQAHVHVYDCANNQESCLEIPIGMAEAIRDNQNELQESAVSYLASMLLADWN